MMTKSGTRDWGLGSRAVTRITRVRAFHILIPNPNRGIDRYYRYGYNCYGPMTPLTPAVFHILLALASTERHGYGIQKEIQRHTNGGLRMGPGTLYGTIQRLLERGWIEEAANASRKTIDERRRSYYRLTRAGRSALDGEVERMDGLVRAARAERVIPRAARG